MFAYGIQKTKNKQKEGYVSSFFSLKEELYSSFCKDLFQYESNYIYIPSKTLKDVVDFVFSKRKIAQGKNEAYENERTTENEIHADQRLFAFRSIINFSC